MYISSSKHGSMLELIQKYHFKQTRNNGKIPYWHHCDRVAQLLIYILDKTEECIDFKKEHIILAALGHDLYEDTKCSRDEIINMFGPEVDDLIWQVTNELGDDKYQQYLDKLEFSSEEAILIKLADIYDNMESATYSISENGLEITKNIWLPLLERQWLQIQKYPAQKYTKSFALLCDLVSLSYLKLISTIKRLEQFPL